MDKSQSTPEKDLENIINSAKRLGIELDQTEALQWLTAMAVKQDSGDIIFDTREGVFGHRVSMLDFSTADLEHFREIGRLVEFNDVPGVVETALALSGSAAQSKIQTYPGDADYYFERINIIADSKDAACRILGGLMRDKVLSTEKGPNYQLIQVRMGSYPEDITRGGQTFTKGSSIEWDVDEIRAGEIDVLTKDGGTITMRWDERVMDPGWCKLDWVVADPERKELVNASNMLDVTWEGPDGTIVPLDGYLDPYFQEVYLEAQSVPIFSKLAQHVSANALDDYVHQLEKEIIKYLTKSKNYGKAAKRMYNVFRLTGRYEEAAFIRELFDEPTSLLYQVWALMRTMEECSMPDSTIPIENVQAQADKLILEVIQALEGDHEVTVVQYLLRLRDGLEDQKEGQPLTAEVDAARAEVINIVNNFFYEKLIGYPEIKDYIEDVQLS